MRALYLATFSLILFSDQFAVAQKAPVSGARMQWYGVYTAAKSTKEEEDKTISERIVGPNINSDRIEKIDRTRFGFGYRLEGPSASAIVKIRHIRKRPNETTETQIEVAIGQSDLFIGTIIDDDLHPGVHIHQVWYENRKLLEKQFILFSR